MTIWAAGLGAHCWIWVGQGRDWRIPLLHGGLDGRAEAGGGGGGGRGGGLGQGLGQGRVHPHPQASISSPGHRVGSGAMLVG